jgi:hypothetical protein
VVQEHQWDGSHTSPHPTHSRILWHNRYQETDISTHRLA